MDHSRGYCIPDPCLDLSTEEVLQRTPEVEDFLAYAELRQSVEPYGGTNFPMLRRTGSSSYTDVIVNRSVNKPEEQRRSPASLTLADVFGPHASPFITAPVMIYQTGGV